MIDERIRSSIGAINTLLKAISLFHYQTLQTFTLYRTKVVAKRFKLSIVRTNQTNRTNKTHSFWSNIDIPIDIKCRQKIYCFRSYKKKGGSSDRHIYGFMMDRTTLCVVFFACVSPNKKATRSRFGSLSLASVLILIMLSSTSSHSQNLLQQYCSYYNKGNISNKILNLIMVCRHHIRHVHKVSSNHVQNSYIVYFPSNPPTSVVYSQ